jgi:Tfp pilus assembly protein PilF/thiol-disulfide isomerase/thioredoxin
VSQSPADPEQTAADYLEGWNALATRIQHGQSFSGRERNCCFLNTGGGPFADISAATGLDLIDDGRGLAFVDWDHDGDLDCWFANRTGPRVRLMVNNANTGNHFLSIRLEGKSCNRDAIGARVAVYLTSQPDRPLVKSLRAGEGFLSQSSKTIQFGLGEDVAIDRVVVRWPGSAEDDVHRNILPDRRYRITQGSAAVLMPPRSPVNLKHHELPVEFPGGPSRTILTQRRPLSAFDVTTGTGTLRHVEPGAEGPLCISLWASWCAPCIEELAEFERVHAKWAECKIKVLALCVDQVHDESADGSAAMEQARQWPSLDVGFATIPLLKELVRIDQEVFYRRRPLPLPCGFLLDSKGRVAAVYKGRVDAAQLVADCQLLDGSNPQPAQAGSPLGGKNIAPWFSPTPVRIAQAFLEGNYLADAKATLEQFIDQSVPEAPASAIPTQRKDAYRLLIQIARRENDASAEVTYLQRLLELAPDLMEVEIELLKLLAKAGQHDEWDKTFQSFEQKHRGNVVRLVEIGQTGMKLGRIRPAIELLSRAVRDAPDSIEARFTLAMAHQVAGQASEAVDRYRELLARRPDMLDVANNLSWLLATHHDPSIRNVQEALRLAQLACQTTGFKNPSYLDTLSAAHAANGDFAAAREVIQRAISIAATEKNVELVQKLTDHLHRYEANQAMFDDARSPSHQ